MAYSEIIFQPGERVVNVEYGEGVVVAPAREGYLRVFFPSGERQVPQDAIRRQLSRTERVLNGVSGWRRPRTQSLALFRSERSSYGKRSLTDLSPNRFIASSDCLDASRRDRVATSLSHRGQGWLRQDD